MRYAIFSDVHANRQAWGAVLADALREGADTLVCLGDVVGYGPKPLEVLASVREVTPNFVLGNHDAAACGRLDPSIFNERARIVIEWTRDCLDEESLEFLRQVPLQMDGSGIQFVHAEVMEPGEFGYVDGLVPAELNLQAMTQPLAFIGHTHLPLAYTMPRKGGATTQLPPLDFEVESGRRYLINVGSVGEPRTTDVRASYVIYDDAAQTVSFRKVAFDVEAYKEDLAETGLEILPYFVQVVDAGKVAGAPEPAAAPQLALAQLPSVTEVVAGHHGRLVLGESSENWGTGAAAVRVAQPKAVPPWVLGLVVAVVLVVVGAVAIVAMKKADQTAAQLRGAGTGREGGAQDRETASESTTLQPTSSGTVRTARIDGLKVRLFAKAFQTLDELRAADANETPDRVENLEENLLSLAHAHGREAFGLVWEGNLQIPETGEYEFSLQADAGAAFFIRTDLVVEVEGGEKSDVGEPVFLQGGRETSIRVEFYGRSRTQRFELNCSGPGFDGEVTLVGDGPERTPAGVADTPREGESEPVPAPRPEPEPEPPVEERVAPERMTQDLLAYWSCDRRETARSRFEKREDGRVLERLIMEGDPVRYLVPSRNPRKPWYSPRFDDSNWEEGTNGIGYEREPGGFKDLIATPVGKPGQYPHSVYVRVPFTVNDPEAYDLLVLGMRCDDGFVAYLNGIRIDSNSSNAPLADLRWNSAATAPRKENENEGAEENFYPPIKVDLREGENLLAIHGLNHGGEPNKSNTGAQSSDMLILPSLVARRKDSTLPPATPPRTFRDDDLPVKESQVVGEVELGKGLFREAYRFAQNGSIETGEAERFAIGEKSFTVSLWFTRDATSGQARRLISAGGGSRSEAGWALWVQENGTGMTFRVTDGTEETLASSKLESLQDGEWHHAAVTFDREARNVLLYLDGQIVSDLRTKFPKNGSIASRSGLSIGRSSDGERHHRGMLDDLAIWRRALVEEEVERIFASGQSGNSLGDLFDERGE